VITPIVMGGTGESYPGDPRTEVPDGVMLSFVTRHLDPKFFNAGRWIGYPAQYAGDLSFEQSMAVGVETLKDVITEETTVKGNHVVLLGYSQSAAIMRRLLVECMNGTFGDPVWNAAWIKACGLVADPYRPKFHALEYDPHPGWWGVAGELPVWDRVPLIEMAAHRDPISSVPDNSLIRSVADFSGFFGFSGVAIQRWVSETIQTIQKRGWQNANLDWSQFWLVGQRVDEAIDALGGFLPRQEMRVTKYGDPIVINPGGGRHTCYHLERMPNSIYTFTERLAVELNRIARRDA